MKLFEAKIRPIVTYALHLIAPYLTSANLAQLDIVKNLFLKRALCLPPHSPNNVVYQLCETKRFCEELKDKNYAFSDVEFNKYMKK